MKLVFIYGPPAAGKLTVAKELADLTGYVLFDNHKVVDMVVEIFPRSEPSYEPVRTAASRTIRTLLMAGAAECGINMINTFAPLADAGTGYMAAIEAAVKKHGGEMCYVQLLPSEGALVQRVTSASRQGKKIDTPELWQSVKGRSPFMLARAQDPKHLVIDNSDISAATVAQMIADHFSLR